MAAAKPKYSKGEVDRAGKAMATLPKDDSRRNDALVVVDDWIASHSYPLDVIATLLRIEAEVEDRDSLIAQRTKRRPSVEAKLRRQPKMKLTDMQDLGGCRAIVTSIHNVSELVRSHRQEMRWKEEEVYRITDYITHPKESGYRGVHILARYRATEEWWQHLDKRKIEIQIRTKLQHIWATALETAEKFTRVELKSELGDDSGWLRFFQLASSLFAMEEQMPPVPGTPESREAVIKELRERERSLNAIKRFRNYRDVLDTVLTDERVKGKALYILRLDSNANRLEIRSYALDRRDEGFRTYEQLQNESERNKYIDIVIVTMEDLDDLRFAYSNYYADTLAFEEKIEMAIHGYATL